MITALCYAIVLGFVVYKWGAEFLFKDQSISKKFILLLYLLKLSAIPVFYLVYQKSYGGIALFDTGKYFNDAKIIAHSDFGFFMRCLFGLQDDSPGSADFERYLKFTQNWDNGTIKDYLYNDNRIVIRVHAILELLAQGSYFAHAVFNCSLSFVGIALLYRAFKTEWHSKKNTILLVIVLFPALWFYTGAVLKEGLVLFAMGATANSLRTLFSGAVKTSTLLVTALLFALCFLLKPYLLLSFFITCLLYFFLKGVSQRKTIIIYVVIACTFVVGTAQALSFLIKHRSLQTAAKEHRIRFEALNRGGIFLTKDSLYIQLPADTSLIKLVDAEKKLVRIKSGTNYMYWLPNRQSDTLFAIADSSSAEVYTLLHYIKPAGSAIYLNTNSTSELLLSAASHSLFRPFFIDANGPLQYLASFENLFITLSFVLLLFTAVRTKNYRLYAFLFCVFAIVFCVFIGYTAPNSGAIIRYRAPIIIFIPIAALMRLRP